MTVSRTLKKDSPISDSTREKNSQGGAKYELCARPNGGQPRRFTRSSVWTLEQ
ncbi:MAG: hypothetical protein ABJI96_01865 [Paracoccaceae bacterium]